MALDFTEFFSRYEALRAKADAAFARVKEASGLVTCQPGCSDCCHALFDLSLIEALYVNRRFNELFQGNDRAAILDRADQADRETYRIKRQAFRMSQEGVDASAILEEMAKARVRCPLLADDGTCLVYGYRPMTCRLHGLPLVDLSGEVFHDEWCSLNFTGEDPMKRADLSWGFRELFRDELMLFQEVTAALLNDRISELDTFIPTSLLIDFRGFDWESWWRENSERVRRAGCEAGR